MNSIALAALALCAFSGLTPLLLRRNSAAARLLPFMLLGAGGLLAAYAGVATLLGGSVTSWQFPFGLPWLAWHLRLDALAGLFMAIIGTVVVAVSLYGPRYVREYQFGDQPFVILTLGSGVFVAAMMLVVLADDAFSFMVAWELMSLSSYFLVTFQHQHAANRRAGFTYILMAHVGAVAIMLAFGILVGFGNGFSFASMRAAELSSNWGALAFVLATIGFGMKAGLVPLHVWLPEAHPVAPSHISALMSGVMLKVAVYGFIRFVFDLLGNFAWQWGAGLLVVASITALFGVLYALMQHDLKRLLAYHSVENIGIIFIGLALALVFFGSGFPKLGVLGLIAALYHTINHALFKSLLFLGAGAVIQRTREHDMERMGGLLRVMPWTGLFFLVGCISISALPPFNGFVSEWLTFQTALLSPALKSGVLRALIPSAAAVLALTGALAATCFVKVYGIAFLGQMRGRNVRRARESTPGMILGQGLLAMLCLAFGVFPTFVVQALNHIPAQILGTGLPSAVSRGWLWLTPISPQSASYNAPHVALGMLLALGAWAAVYFALRPHRRRKPVLRSAAWDCGYGVMTPRNQYTATAFTMPIREVFKPVWKIEESVEEKARAGLPEYPIATHYRLQVSDLTWSWLYDRVITRVAALARRVSKIQTGHLRHYLAYSFFTVLFLMWLTTR